MKNRDLSFKMVIFQHHPAIWKRWATSHVALTGVPLKQRGRYPVGGVWIQIISLPPWKRNVLAMDLRCWGGVGGDRWKGWKKTLQKQPTFGWLAGWRLGEHIFGWLNVLVSGAGIFSICVIFLLLEELGLNSFSCGLWLFVCWIFFTRVWQRLP